MEKWGAAFKLKYFKKFHLHLLFFVLFSNLLQLGMFTSFLLKIDGLQSQMAIKKNMLQDRYFKFYTIF